MIPEKKPLNTLAFFSSIFFLSVLFFIYLSLRPVPAHPESYVYLSNLRAVTESGSFFGLEEPLSILLLYFWKSLFNLNYLTSFQSLAAFLFSLSLHLILLFFRKGDWKLNHYFLVYLSAFLPLSHEFPVVFFNELLAFIFILLVFHTFRLETIWDLLLFPLLVIFAFFADLRLFLLGFTLFVVIETIKSGERVKSKTTVFYKKKNIPYIILLTYLSLWGLFLLLSSVFDFFSSSSFLDILIHWGERVLYLLPAFACLLIGRFLLETEKELRTLTFTIILCIGILGVVFWNYSQYNSSSHRELELEKDEWIRIGPQLGSVSHSFIPSEKANFFYFKTKIPTNYIREIPPPAQSAILVEEIWQADINEINRLYIPRRRRQTNPLVIPVGERGAVITREIEEKILQEKENTPLRSKVLEAGDKLQKLTPYLRFLEWQQEFIGFSHLQKISP